MYYDYDDDNFDPNEDHGPYWPKYGTEEGGDWDEILNIDFVGQWIDEFEDNYNVPELSDIKNSNEFRIAVETVWDEYRLREPVDIDELIEQCQMQDLISE